MIDNSILNTCWESTNSLHTIAYYSHFVPVIAALVLAFFVYKKSDSKILAHVFMLFVGAFSLWLLLDVVAWTSQNYYLIHFVWSLLDYINIVFYLAGFYLFWLIVKKKDIATWLKFVMFAIQIPALYLIFQELTVIGFDQTWCESIEGSFVSLYKVIVEIVVILAIIVLTVVSLIKEWSIKGKKVLIVAFGFLLFFVIFAITEYIAVQTGFYEINLYGLFSLPVFIAIIVFSITNLGIFDFRILGTQVITVMLIILIAAQFLFLDKTSDKILNSFTLVLSFIFGMLLLLNVKKEESQKQEIELLAKNLASSNDNLYVANEKLKELDKLKTEFLSLATHQLRSPLTAIKGYTSMILDNSYGAFSETLKEPLTRIFQSTQNLAKVIEDFLNVSKIEQGGMKYQFVQLNIIKLLSQMVKELEVLAQGRGLDLKIQNTLSESEIVFGDEQKLRQVFLNFIDNAIKYTISGSILVRIVLADINHIRVDIIDTGAGISAEDKSKLFQKFGRTQSGRLNTGGSGLGLYLAKKIIADHKGEIVVESEGVGKGTTFSVILSKHENSIKS
ncbi:MAG: hypothetical protein K9M36_03025 [Candidatus Pacebacteria bacterium]|nr:hypothetical protein [Candidatus Paceibacterota bacterium]